MVGGRDAGVGTQHMERGEQPGLKHHVSHRRFSQAVGVRDGAGSSPFATSLAPVPQPNCKATETRRVKGVTAPRGGWVPSMTRTDQDRCWQHPLHGSPPTHPPSLPPPPLPLATSFVGMYTKTSISCGAAAPGNIHPPISCQAAHPKRGHGAADDHPKVLGHSGRHVSRAQRH
jgi:hypothetical protein